MLSQPMLNYDEVFIRGMSTCEGKNLANLDKREINKSEQLPDMIQLLQEVANEPNHISKNKHEQQFVHTDLKPPLSHPFA